jgi:hypothetical protein
MAAERFTTQKFLGRLAAALVLVFATYNPSGYSYLHWVTAEEAPSLRLLILVGLALLIAFLVFLRATIAVHWPRGYRTGPGLLWNTHLVARRLRPHRYSLG